VPSWGVVIIVVCAAGVSAIGVYFLVLRSRKRQQVVAMSPAERELYESEKEYGTMVNEAEKEYKASARALDIEVNAAQKGLKKAVDGVNKVLGRHGLSVCLYEDRVETPDGVAHFEDGPVTATVDTAGNIAVSQRITLTRLVAGGVIGGIIFPKKKITDSRELYLLIESPTFASVVKCPPDKGAKVRQFAAKLTNTSRNALSLMQARQRKIADMQALIESTQAKREQGCMQAGQRLEAVKQQTQRVTSARLALGLSDPCALQSETGADQTAN